ncbi:MAG: YqeG family HAD IIIA-type phosphatase [Acidaminococcaceae bacterium]|nr:YqeG family HAD IIIA-type phosphatase [Acidaminococcaceae bacterium]
MWHLFCPDFRYNKISDINELWLREHGIDTIILDVDNTLLPYNADKPQAENIVWIKQLRSAGVRMILLSNNGGQRLEKICAEVGVSSISWAAKPLSLGFKRALHALRQRDKKSVLVIGDQLLTDVLGAKSMGLKVAWVETLSRKEFVLTGLTRKVEHMLVNKLVQKGMMPTKER